MPFMNVFFPMCIIRVMVQSESFAWGSLAMGVGLLIAPALAERFGKIRVVVFLRRFPYRFNCARFFLFIACFNRLLLGRCYEYELTGYSTYVMGKLSRNRVGC